MRAAARVLVACSKRPAIAKPQGDTLWYFVAVRSHHDFGVVQAARMLGTRPHLVRTESVFVVFPTQRRRGATRSPERQRHLETKRHAQLCTLQIGGIELREAALNNFGNADFDVGDFV